MGKVFGLRIRGKLMLFVKTSKLKKGMRLARPIYNKNGVLLYERNSKLTAQGIETIRKFGLIGLFILEPAEPVPPMTQADIDFERFQTMGVFAIREELARMVGEKRSGRIQVIASNVIREYGHLEEKVNFIQNLRSREDYLYKHSLNVAILCAMITHVMNLRLEEQLSAVMASIVHDVGKLSAPVSLLEKDDLSDDDRKAMRELELQGYDLLDKVFTSDPAIRRICMQTQRMLEDLQEGRESEVKPVAGAKVMAVAETFDTMTAMRLEGEPASEVAALKYLMGNPQTFEPAAVDALIQSIHILAPGVSVELSTGEKGLVIADNPYDVLRPMVLGFRNNNIIDLADTKRFGALEIKDIMKTMDNRYVMDREELRRRGFSVDEPEYVEVPEEA